jgi:hypothetical protein
LIGDAQFHHNYISGHRELRSVRIGHGEWDSEYGFVVNASLPFDDCAAHVGGEGWGWQGVSFGDLQVRAYVTSPSAEDVLLRVKTQSFSVAQSIAERQNGFAAGAKGGLLNFHRTGTAASNDYISPLVRRLRWHSPYRLLRKERWPIPTRARLYGQGWRK